MRGFIVVAVLAVMSLGLNRAPSEPCYKCKKVAEYVTERVSYTKLLTNDDYCGHPMR